MDKLKVVTEKDLKEAESIARIRVREEERKKRIFNAKTRTIGVDADALQEQIEEKRRQMAQQREMERKFVAKTTLCSEVAHQLEVEAQDQRRRIDEDINEYRRRFQRREDTREWDLNDPRMKWKTPPARINDSDPRLCVSSGQMFLGEDLTMVERLRLQKEQQRLWLESQMADRRRRQEDQRKAELAFQRATQVRDQVAMDLERNEQNNRRKFLAENAKINQRLARERMEENLRARHRESQDNLAEMCNFVTSDMLTENPEAAKSVFGPNRKIPYMFRGMSPEEIRSYRENQLQQIAEKKEQEHIDKVTKDQWDGLEKKFARMSAIEEMTVNRRAREHRTQLQEENQTLADEQKTQLNHLNTVVYRNSPTNEYFSQFNTTTR
ncbi:RIB43A [Sergentomyia squamirostris]